MDAGRRRASCVKSPRLHEKSETDEQRAERGADQHITQRLVLETRATRVYESCGGARGEVTEHNF